MLATWSALQWSPHCHQGKGIDCLAWPPHTIPWGRHNLGLSAWAHGTAVRPCSIRSFSFPPAAATGLLGRPFWDFRHPLWTKLQRSSYLNQPTLKSSNSLRIHLCIMMRVQTFTLLRLPRHCILECRSYAKEALTRQESPSRVTRQPCLMFNLGMRRTLEPYCAYMRDFKVGQCWLTGFNRLAEFHVTENT